jgi:phage terminase small subunit|nr:MAG TPA: Terminase small subunit [Caudoviricetes sp.]
MTGNAKLTPKQKRFVEEYVIDCNATQAAIRAGYSPKTAYSIGQENLKKPEVMKAIAEKQKKLSERTEYDALAWRKDMLEYKKTLEQKVLLGDDEAAVETFTDPTNLMKCMDMLGKHLGAYNKDESEKDGIEKVAEALMRMGDSK